MPDFDTPLFLDVTDDLQRVDAFMTKLVNDRSLWDDFLDNPNGVMIRLGFHPATTDEINARVNRGMWALLGDAELMTLLGDHYKTFSPERLEELQRYFLDGLSDGVIRHKLDYDYQALQHLLDDTSSLRRILRRQLVVLNEAGALEGRRTDEEIDAYVDSFLAALEARAPVRDHPKLVTWDDYYGIGQDGGGQLWGEAAAAVTAFVGVQVAAYVTAVVDVGLWGVVMERSMNDAISGNEDALRAVAMMGRALDLGAEILVHAQSYRAEGG